MIVNKNCYGSVRGIGDQSIFSKPENPINGMDMEALTLFSNKRREHMTNRNFEYNEFAFMAELKEINLDKYMSIHKNIDPIDRFINSLLTQN